MLTLNRLLQTFEDIKTNNAQLSNGTFYFGDPWEFGANAPIQYPFMGMVLNGSNINGNLITTSFKVFFCDLVHKDESNEQDVLSDMQYIAVDVYSEIKRILEDGYPATVSITSPLIDFTERFDDDVTGWEMDITIEQFYDHSTCDIPNSAANAGKARIIDQDGNILAYLSANQSYTVEVLQAIIDTITNNTTTIVDPIV